MKSVIISRTLQSLAPRARIARVIVALAFAGLFTAACKDSTSPRTVTALTIISPTTPQTIPVNGTVQFTAQAKNADGDILAVTPTWSVSGGGTISQTGLFTAGSTPGTSTVSVTCSGKTVTATVTVTAGALLTITVTPNPVTLAILTQQQFTAVGRDANGNVVAITPVWSTVNPPGTINSSTGLFTAGTTIGAFPNTVRATQGTIFGTATVNVIAGPLFSITVLPNPATLNIGATQQFTAVGRDAGNNVVPIPAPLVWSTVNPPGTINSSTGLFTAGNTVGTFPNTVRATSGAIFGTATVIVTSIAAPSLGLATPFAILAGAGITCAISGTVTGATSPADIGSSPTTTVTGFPTTCTLDGSIPLTAVVAAAKTALTAAYLAAQGQVCDRDLTGIDLGFFDGSTVTKTLPPGTYCFSTSAGLTGTLNLTGSAAATWTFQIGSTLIAEVGSSVVLAGGAIPNNITWAVGSSATLRTNAAFQGNILALQSITLENGVILLGRALAQVGAVDLTAGAATIVRP
jgi:hypothetical protein